MGREMDSHTSCAGFTNPGHAVEEEYEPAALATHEVGAEMRLRQLLAKLVLTCEGLGKGLYGVLAPFIHDEAMDHVLVELGLAEAAHVENLVESKSVMADAVNLGRGYLSIRAF